ncbi:hypothetical protein [Paenibacillus cremeus]|uniref:Uncharacterized protein n=1 Tax=Paenibacillus cremeus TaxID=2163881 RepID=A0A559K037_9BACL|nr:hypothetical protein [Paenibacillus cremeus]TVY05493.1 hypothetical protein FPZ49_29790 [Paenibacillus cremeus]
MLTSETMMRIRAELKPTMEVRRFLGEAMKELKEDAEHGPQLALLRLKLLTEAWAEAREASELEEHPDRLHSAAHSGASIRQTLQSCFFSQGYYFQLLAQVRQLGLVDASLRRMAAAMAQDILKPAERAANNRSFLFALGHAHASRLFPELPEAEAWSAYAEGVWSDWYEPGDCYEPGYVAHNIKPVIELGLALGKDAELQSEKSQAAYRRYLDHISPSGLAIQPGDGGNQSAYVDALTLMAELTGDGAYLWAAKQALTAGEYGGYYNAKGGRLPADHVASTLEAKFADVGDVKPVRPPAAGGVQYMYPQTYRIADRLILNASRELFGKPYAAFYLNDRMETHHHAHEDNRGDLYHYEVDGVMYLKRSGWHKWAGQSNTFVVDDATSEFPFCYTKGLRSNHWYQASSNLRLLSDYMPSERFKQLYTTPESFKHAGEPVSGDETMLPLPHFYVDQESPHGVFLINPEGMAGKNEQLTVRSITISINTFPRGGEAKFPRSIAWYRDFREVAPSDGPVELLIKDIHLGGPKGKLSLVNLETFADDLEVTFYEDGKKGTADEKRVLTREEVRQMVSLVTDERMGEPALRVISGPGRLDLTWMGLQEPVHLTEEYQRVGFDYLYVSDVREFLRTPIRIFVNGLTCRSFYPDRQQGGVLKEAVSERQGEDSFGSMMYEGVYTYDSKWTRQTLLTEEGFLLVVDRFRPGAEADGMAGGPVWQIGRPEEQGLNWFDATADAQQGKKLMVYFHPQRGCQYGVQFQPKLWHDQAYAAYAKAELQSGREETFVSVIVPHDAAVSGVAVSGKANYHSLLVRPGEESKGIFTDIQPDGTVKVTLHPAASGQSTPLKLELSRDGGWRVSR